MIVVAIIGILAAIALPAYQDYTIRARVSEGILATSQCRTAVAETYQTAKAGAAPGVDGWGCGENATTTQYVSAVNTDANGVITVTLSNAAELSGAKGTTISLAPTASNGTALTIAAIPTQVGGFKCEPGLSGTAIAVKYLPGSCK
jgi:type IV pilus assembly protein PilA